MRNSSEPMPSSNALGRLVPTSRNRQQSVSNGSKSMQRSRSASQTLTTRTSAGYLPRSTIVINPFGQFRRKFGVMGSASREKVERQLVDELLVALDDYIAAFSDSAPVSQLNTPPISPGLSMSPPILRSKRSEADVSRTSSRGSRPVLLVSRSELSVLSDEVDSLVEEIIERFPDFHSAFSAYGPLTLPISSRRPRYPAYEPGVSSDAEFWAKRLRRDLADVVNHASDMGGETEVLNGDVGRPATLKSTWSGLESDSAESGRRDGGTASDKSEALLEAGMRRCTFNFCTHCACSDSVYRERLCEKDERELKELLAPLPTNYFSYIIRRSCSSIALEDASLTGQDALGIAVELI